MSHLIACPGCKKHLQVPDNLVGQTVQCPECKHTFTAALPEGPEPVGATTATPRKPAWEEKSSSEGERPSEERRKRFDDDRDDDDRDRPRRRRRSGRGTLPHRGGMILTFGIIGLVGSLTLVIPAIFGIFAWFMGSNDLREIQAGRMDPEGEGMTQAGRVCGIIGAVIGGLEVLGCAGYFCCIALFFGIAGANANRNIPPPPIQQKAFVPPPKIAVPQPAKGAPRK